MKLEELRQEFCSQVQRGQLKGALVVSKRTAEYLRTHIAHHRYPDAPALLTDVKATGGPRTDGCDTELVIGNIVRRVLLLIREAQEDEAPVVAKEGDRSSSSTSVSLLSLETMKGDGSGGEKPSAKKSKNWSGKQTVIDGINELIDDLGNIPTQIAQEGIDLIHANEMVLTYGYSETVLQFLTMACETRPELEVIVAEAAPELKGYEMARSIRQLGITVTVITDAAIFALMARVNKVFVSCHEILTDGGIIARSGISIVAAAAQFYSVPFVVLVGTHKLSPILPKDPLLTLNEFQSPHNIIQYRDIQHLADGRITVINPSMDFIPPEQISLLVTDQGGMTPNNISMFMSEHYSRDDYEL